MAKWLFLMPILALIGCSATPEPKFDLVGKSGSFEVRRYHARLIAKTTVDGSYEGAPNDGFRRLADYIFGNNTNSTSIEMTAPVGVTPAPSKAASSKIEMTAPVAITPSGTGNSQYVIAFVMPENYTLATLPEPNNPQVSIQQMPAETYAVLRFSGTTPLNTVQSRTDELQQFIKSNTLQPTDLSAPASLARYDPPWTLPWFRRNEVQIQIQDPGAALNVRAPEKIPGH